MPNRACLARSPVRCAFDEHVFQSKLPARLHLLRHFFTPSVHASYHQFFVRIRRVVKPLPRTHEEENSGILYGFWCSHGTHKS